MKLVVDAHLPPVLVEWLRRQGHDAVHVIEWNMMSASDEEIWRRASAEARVIVTKDSDYEALAVMHRSGARILWLRVGNIRNRGLISRLALEWSKIARSFEDGARIVEFW